MAIEYNILMANDHLALMDKVNSLTENGWVPIGGVAITSETYTRPQARHDVRTTTHFYQSMIYSFGE